MVRTHIKTTFFTKVQYKLIQLLVPITIICALLLRFPALIQLETLAEQASVGAQKLPSEGNYISKNLAANLYKKYHPILNNEEQQKRLSVPCTVKLPTINEIESYPFRLWSVSRFAAYYNIYHFLVKHVENRYMNNSDKLKVLDFGISSFLTPFNKSMAIFHTTYPGTDIHQTNYPDSSFDIVSADQVLEHTLFPPIAMLEVLRILKKDGIAIFTTVSFNPLHESKGSFHDLWRFFPDSLRILSTPYDGGILSCGFWGSKSFIRARVEYGLGSREEKEFHKANRFALISRNDHVNPILVWIILQK